MNISFINLWSSNSNVCGDVCDDNAYLMFPCDDVREHGDNLSTCYQWPGQAGLSTRTPGGLNVSQMIIWCLIAMLDCHFDQIATQQIGHIFRFMTRVCNFLSASLNFRQPVYDLHIKWETADQWGVRLVTYLTWGVKTPLISTNQSGAFLTAQVLQVAWSPFTFTPTTQPITRRNYFNPHRKLFLTHLLALESL